MWHLKIRIHPLLIPTTPSFGDVFRGDPFLSLSFLVDLMLIRRLTVEYTLDSRSARVVNQEVLGSSRVTCFSFRSLLLIRLGSAVHVIKCH